jgi:serine/threonine-protein kinase
MAPEQFDGTSDARSDVWSAGAVAYELCTGHAPFGGATLASLAAQVRLSDPPPLSVGRDLEAIILTCLEKEPARRYPSAIELAADLARLAASEPVHARRPGAARKLSRFGRRARWPLAVGAIGAIALAATAATMRLSAAERVRRTQELTKKAVELRTTMREAHLLPLHDTRPERAQVRATMSAVERELAALGPVAAATGHYALGSGWAALGQWSRARDELEAAWTAGERDPEATFLLGYAQSRLYHVGMHEARNLAPPERATKEAELARTLRDPALARLREAATPESRDLVEALIAYDEGEYERSLTSAERAFAAAPRRYEAGAIVAEAQGELGRARWLAGDRQAAIDWMDRAADSYRKVNDIARSDDAMYSEAAGRRYETVQLYYERGDAGEDILRELLDLWHKAEQANPDELDHLLGEAHAEDEWAGISSVKGTAWEAHARAAIRICEQVLKTAPDNGRAWMIEGDAWSTLADIGVEDRAGAAANAVRALERAVALRPEIPYRGMLATAYTMMAREQHARGTFSAETWDRARGGLEAILAIDAKNQTAEYNLGDVLASEAIVREEVGEDPRPYLDAAVTHLLRAGELDRSDAMPSKRLASVYADRAVARQRRGQDPGDDLAQARAQLEATTKSDPNRVELARTRAQLEQDAADLDLLLGRDPTAALARARAAADDLEKGWSAELDDQVLMVRATVELAAAHAALVRHGDVERPVRVVLAECARAAKVAPAHPGAWLGIAEAQLRRAQAQARAGRSPAEAVRGALEALDHAAALGQHSLRVDAIRALLYELRARVLPAASPPAALDEARALRAKSPPALLRELDPS